MTDRDGLSRAYQHGDYAIVRDTLYVSGTQAHRHRYADITKVPSALYDMPALQQYRQLMWGFSTSASI